MRIEAAGVTCASVSTDSRELAEGALFVALQGPTHDGHDYVEAARARGALAAVVERRVASPLPQLVVPDTLAWLQDTARRKRAEWGGRVVGVTGSAGKTMVKDAIAAVLATRVSTGKTSGNLNNHIGVPLSILNLDERSEAAVLEIGMNHAGEIAALAAIARPDVGVVTNTGTAHIENFDSIEGVALAKRELVDSLGPHGTAVLNWDDARVREFAKIHAGPVLFYGLGEGADVRATGVEHGACGARFHVEGEGEFETSLPGPAGVQAALAALAAARVFGIAPAGARAAIAALRPPAMRLQRMDRDGMVIWNDCYNSNPEAAKMMLDLLAATPAGRRIAVLGEMLELGRWSRDLHREVGIHAARRGVTVLVGIRGAASDLVDAARSAGLAAGAALFFDEPAEGGRFVKTLARAGDALLFKGSRGTRVEIALEEFLR